MRRHSLIDKIVIGNEQAEVGKRSVVVVLCSAAVTVAGSAPPTRGFAP